MARRLTLTATAGATAKAAFRRVTREFSRPSLQLSSAKINKTALPIPILRGNIEAGEAILTGKFRYAGDYIDVGTSGDPWTIALPSVEFAKDIHRFIWLDDLAAAGAPVTGPKARELIHRWIAVYGKWNTFSWDVDILTDRVLSWMAHMGKLLSADSDNATERNNALLRQLKYLKKNSARVSPGLMQIKAQIALALGGAITDDQSMADRAIDQLEDLLQAQFLGDGGHISRNPHAIIEATYYLLMLEKSLGKAKMQPSKGLRRALDRMSPALTFFTHAHGDLAAFNGSGHTARKLLNELTRKSGVKSKAFSYMPHSGYQRLERNSLVALMDVGETPARPFDLNAHLAPLAIEVSSKSGALIKNCGWTKSQPANWRNVMRETAAHSTLVLDDCSTGRILEGGFRHKLFGPAVQDGVDDVRASRKELDGAIWVDSVHDGYLSSTGLSHRRRLFMSESGKELRGEDTLFVPAGQAPKYSGAQFPFALRFHIDPSVKVTLARNGQSALLIQGKREGWRFRTAGRKLALESSISLGKGDSPEKTTQIVIYGDALSDNDGEDRSNRVMWMLTHLSEEENA